MELVETQGGLGMLKGQDFPGTAQTRRILDVTFPEDGKSRARRIISRSRARPTGLFPSRKLGRMVHWESPHERNAFVLLDFDPTVATYQEQPLVIRYFDGEDVRLHYPDVLVTFDSGNRELWEVKPAEEARQLEVAQRSALMSTDLPRFGYKYHVAYGEDLAAEPRLSNALTILRYGRKQSDPLTHERLVRVIREAGGVTWEFVHSTECGEHARATLCLLILKGQVEFDFDSPLAPNTRFTPSQRSAWK